MKAGAWGAGVLAMTAGGAMAGGVDRSGQGIGILFEPGRVVELSFGQVSPRVEGTDIAGQPTGDVTEDYAQIGLGLKYDLTDRLSFALVLDQPFGADIRYPASSPLLGGTRVDAQSAAATGVLRYRFDGGASVYAGLRAQRARAEIDLRGLAYGALDGYSVRLDRDTAPGYLLGAAYERPDIALRVALTWNSPIVHDFATTETLGGAPIAPVTVTDVRLPQSVNLDAQTGIAADTLVFGQIRWVDWSALRLTPAGFGAATGGASLIELDDTTTFTLGVGRRFDETWSGTVAVTYEDGTDPLVSPLSPTNGRKGVTLGLVYTQGAMRVTGGVNYTWIGDARPETGTPDTARAEMTGNRSVGLGLRVAYTF